MASWANTHERLLIVAVTARALAQSARRAGFAPLVLDAFGDTDTRETAQEVQVLEGSEGSLDHDRILEAAQRWQPAGLVYGGGIAKRADLLRDLARIAPLRGNRPETAALAGDGPGFFALLERLGIPHPETRQRAPAAPRGWLVKETGRDGGGHVRPADALRGAPPPVEALYQRRVPGHPVSLLFLADGRDIRIVGYNRGLPVRGPVPPFQYGGAVAKAPPSAPAMRTLEEAATQLTRELGLVGLNGLDAVVSRGRAWVLELNPRPTATAELYDADSPGGILAAHLAACTGHLPQARLPEGPARAVAVVYAAHRVAMPESPPWPHWVSDRPAAGTVMDRGQPVCTVHTQARHPVRAQEEAHRRQYRLERWLHDNHREAG